MADEQISSDSDHEESPLKCVSEDRKRNCIFSNNSSESIPLMNFTNESLEKEDNMKAFNTLMSGDIKKTNSDDYLTKKFGVLQSDVVVTLPDENSHELDENRMNCFFTDFHNDVKSPQTNHMSSTSQKPTSYINPKPENTSSTPTAINFEKNKSETKSKHSTKTAADNDPINFKSQKKKKPKYLKSLSFITVPHHRQHKIPENLSKTQSNEEIITTHTDRIKKFSANPTIETNGKDGVKKKSKTLSVTSIGNLIDMAKNSPMIGRRRKGKKNKSIEAKSKSSSSSKDTPFYKVIMNRFKESARKELKYFYSQIILPLPMKWTKKHEALKIEDLFVSNELTFSKNAVKLEDILCVKPNRISSNPVIVIKGQSGIGKTALCQYITHCWQNKDLIKTLNSYDMLFMFECKFVGNSSLLESVKTMYIKDSLDHLPSTMDDELLFTILGDMEIIFILDGFDESGDGCKNKVKLIRTLLPNSKIIITTKKYGIKEVRDTLDLDMTYDVIELLLEEFDDHKIVEFVGKASCVYEISNKDQDNLLKYIDEKSDKLLPILRVPLNLFLFFLIWVHQKELMEDIETTNDLFKNVFFCILNQLFISLGMKRYADVNQGKRLITRWILEVGKIALSCIKSRQFYFAPIEYDSIKRYSTSLGVNIYKALPIIMQVVTHMPSRHLRIFFHTTIMEYLAATYIEHSIASNEISLFSAFSNTRISISPISNQCSCFSQNVHAHKITNIEKRNTQLDSVVSFLIDISIEQGSSSYMLGEEVAHYFPLKYNRNLPILAAITERLVNKCDRLFKGFKKGLSAQSLPSIVNIWNIKHVITLIKSSALKPTILIEFSVEFKYDWGETVNDLVKLGCRPYVVVIIDQAEHMQSLLKALRTIEEPRIPKLMLHFEFLEFGIAEMVESWPYPNPVHISSIDSQKYSIEAYLACIAVVNTMGKSRIKHVTYAAEEANYIYGLLKKSLPGTTIHFRPIQHVQDYVVISTK